MALRILGIASASTMVGVAYLHSRLGCKCKAAKEEFNRPSFNSPPKNWTGPIFRPKLDYPAKCPPSKIYPWESIDFKAEPESYMQTVLEYCFDVNVDNDFVPQKNHKRKWYHTPWMCQNTLGREPIHGLTFEHPAPKKYLADTQNRVCQSWAVSMYNEEGGYGLGEMWNKCGQPIIKDAKFPYNTVVFKLLFTEATPEDIPFLNGSPTWKATIATKPLPHPSVTRTPPTDLHLLQVDIAVRERRADDTTGWVFGTFMYHNSVKNENAWRRLMPVCLMWGDDPDLTEIKYNQGERPKESWVNPKASATLPKNRPYFGWLQRGNGPVDNFKSSCISCHSTASNPVQPILPNNKYPKMDWFRNIKAGEKFRPGPGVSLDYSLQLSDGFSNYDSWSKRWKPIPALPVFLTKQAFPEKRLENEMIGRGIDPCDYTSEELEHITPQKKN